MSKPNLRADEIFSAAAAISDATERAVFLKQACGDDEALRDEVQSLLTASAEAGTFLETPAAGAPAGDAPSNGETLASAQSNVGGALAEQPGDRIGRYKLLEKIGEGGMGVVWMAAQEEPVRRRVALKVIKLGMDTKEVVARFEAERQALALMDHPNIAKVHDGGATETGRPYFVMELVRGVRITDYCDQHRLSTAQRLELFTHVCQAVQHAHQKGVIHRDLKPSNILVTVNDGVPVPKIIDFGIAKATDQRLTDKTVFTRFLQFMGTPAYMSPEQAELTSLDIDTRSDIYALGVLLYELLTGHTPFDGQELLAAGLDELRRVIREQEPPRPSTRLGTLRKADLTSTAERRRTEPPKLIANVSGDLDWIVMKCLEKDRTRRYETATSLAQDLQRHLRSEPVLARPPSTLYRWRKFSRKHRTAVSVGGGFVVLLATAAVVSTALALWATRERNDAVLARQAESAQRSRAEKNEKAARIEASRSEETVRFLKEMLTEAAPSVAMGRDTTLLLEVADRIAKRLGQRLQGQPEVEAEVRTTLGQLYHDLEQFGKMEAMAREALRLCQSSLGETHPKTITARILLGDALGHRSDPRAEPLLRESLAILRNAGKSAELIHALHRLANVLRTRSHGAEAEVLAREALQNARTLHGTESVNFVVSSHQLLGDLLLDQRRLKEAETCFREALELRRQQRGNTHPTVAPILGRLAEVLVAGGAGAEAETVLREALTIGADIDVAAPSETGRLHVSLAKVLHAQRKGFEAGVVLSNAVARARRRQADHPAQLEGVLTAVAGGWFDLRGFSEAEALYREILLAQQARVPTDEIGILDSKESLALLLMEWT